MTASPDATVPIRKAINAYTVTKCHVLVSGARVELASRVFPGFGLLFAAAWIEDLLEHGGVVTRMIEHPTPSVIDVRIQEIGQLFNTLDPSPFHQRDLDRDAEDHIIEWARELPKQAPIVIRLHMPPDEAGKARDRGTHQAITNYFAGRADRAASELKELVRTGWHYLPIGLTVLAICLITSQVLKGRFGTSPLVAIVAEGLVIVGWVANWRPLEIFLYDWWPIARRRRLCARLSSATVEIVEK